MIANSFKTLNNINFRPISHHLKTVKEQMIKLFLHLYRVSLQQMGTILYRMMTVKVLIPKRLVPCTQKIPPPPSSSYKEMNADGKLHVYFEKR